MLLVQLPGESRFDPLWAGCSSTSAVCWASPRKGTFGKCSLCLGVVWNTREYLIHSCRGVVAGHACPCGVQPHGRFVASGEGHAGVQGCPPALVFRQIVQIYGREGFGARGASAGRGPFKRGSAGGQRPPAFTPGVGKGGGPRRP